MQTATALTPQQQDTFRVLSLRSNLASVDVLGEALRSNTNAIRSAALQTLMARGGEHDMAKILEMIDHCHAEDLPILIQQVEQFVAPVEAGMASKDPVFRQRSLLAISKLQIASQFHQLVSVAQSPEDPQQIVAAQLLIELACQFGANVRNAKIQSKESIRQQLLDDLARSMAQYQEHRVNQIFEAWFCAAHWNDESFKELFQPDRRDIVAKTAIRMLKHANRREIVDLLMGILWSSGHLREAFELLGERKDQNAASVLTDRISKSGNTSLLAKNLRLGVKFNFLEEFDFRSQKYPMEQRCVMLKLISMADVSPAKLLASINAMLVEKDRQAEAACAQAIRALKNVKPEIIMMVLSNCFESPDIDTYEPPPWKAEFKKELERLIELYPVLPPEIRTSVENAFSEFKCETISNHLDDWPEAHLRAYGRIVRIAQSNCVEYLEREADSQAVSKRIRTLKLVRMLGVDGDLLDLVKDMLSDPSEAVRIEAIYAIAAERNKREVVELLRPMLMDEDNGVKVAADMAISQLEGK